MGADQQRLKRRIAARARSNYISGSVNAHIKLCLAHQAHGIFASLAVRLAVGYPAHSALRFPAELRQLLQVLHDASAVNPKLLGRLCCCWKQNGKAKRENEESFHQIS